MAFSINLSTKNFTWASKIAGNDEFLFIIGDEKVSCHKFVAAFLSRSISQILVSDPTLDHIHIDIGNYLNPEQKQQKVTKIQSILHHLIFGEEIEISKQDLQDFISELNKINKNTKIAELSPTTVSSLLLLNQTLKNDEINNQIYRHIFSTLITRQENNSSTNKGSKVFTKDEIEQKIIFIQKVELFLNVIENSQEKENSKDFVEYAIHYLEQEYSEIIDEIATHFFEIDEKLVFEMNENLLNSVLSSPKLQVESEDSFLTLLLNRRKHLLSKNENGEFFIEKVEFEYLSEKAVRLFLSEIEFEDIDYNIWSQIKKRLVLPVQIKSSKNQRHKEKPPPTFSYNISDPFNGILNHLSKVSNGNIQSNKTIEISASRLCCGKFDTLVDYQKEDGFTHVSGSPCPRWLQIDFKSRKIQVDSYLIKSPKSDVSSGVRKLKTWKVEVSNDASNWKLIDERKDVSELKGDHSMQLFKIKESSEPFRYFRIITDQDNWNNDGGFNICKLELFGNIIE